jgi:molybdopterin-guanine dinucleotide biosynthesis protein A
MRSAVLAGGTASRFGGRPKGLEKVGGVRILDRVVEVVTVATGASPVLVANAPEAQQWIDGIGTVRVRDRCWSWHGTCRSSPWSSSKRW